MNDETILDQSQFNEDLKEEQQIPEESIKETKKSGKIGAAAAAAGVAGVAGVGLGMAMPLIPKLVFPNSSDDLDILGDDGNLEEEPSPIVSVHLTGHDMEVATGVDDSMSFNQAFASARHEVGPGGLFVWHGNTYGTYYANEWNAMSSDDKAQYWADVSHSTSNLSSGDDGGIDDAPIDDFEIPEVPVGGPAGDDGGIDDAPIDDHEISEVPVEGLAGDGEDIPSIEAPEPLVLNEEDVIAEFDTDGNGLADMAVVDANGNDIADVIVDTTGDGNYDTLVIDPAVDDNGELVVTEENIVEIGGVEMEDDSNLALDDNGIAPVDEFWDNDKIIVPDDETIANNPDVDNLASLDPDPEAPIDNNMDMSDFA